MSFFGGVSDFAKDLTGVTMAQDFYKKGMRTSDGSFNWGMVPYIGAGFSNERNIEFQREQQEYDRRMQQEQWAREDTSIARRTADLRASGLSPVLAAGSGASAGSLISSKAPQSGDTSDSAMQVMALLQSASQLESQKAQRDAIASNIETQNDQQLSLRSQAFLNKITADIKKHDLQIYKKTGTTSNATGLVADLRNAYGFSESPIVNSAKKQIKERFTIDPNNEYNQKLLKGQTEKYDWLDEFYNSSEGQRFLNK